MEGMHKSLDDFEIIMGGGGGGGGEAVNFCRFYTCSFKFLHVSRACIKGWTSSNFGQIGPSARELHAASLVCIKSTFSQMLLIRYSLHRTGLYL